MALVAVCELVLAPLERVKVKFGLPVKVIVTGFFAPSGQYEPPPAMLYVGLAYSVIVTAGVVYVQPLRLISTVYVPAVALDKLAEVPAFAAPFFHW